MNEEFEQMTKMTELGDVLADLDEGKIILRPGFLRVEWSREVVFKWARALLSGRTPIGVICIARFGEPGSGRMRADRVVKPFVIEGTQRLKNLQAMRGNPAAYGLTDDEVKRMLRVRHLVSDRYYRDMDMLDEDMRVLSFHRPFEFGWAGPIAWSEN